MPRQGQRRATNIDRAPDRADVIRDRSRYQVERAGNIRVFSGPKQSGSQLLEGVTGLITQAGRLAQDNRAEGAREGIKEAQTAMALGGDPNAHRPEKKGIFDGFTGRKTKMEAFDLEVGSGYLAPQYAAKVDELIALKGSQLTPDELQAEMATILASIHDSAATKDQLAGLGSKVTAINTKALTQHKIMAEEKARLKIFEAASSAMGDDISAEIDTLVLGGATLEDVLEDPDLYDSARERAELNREALSKSLRGLLDKHHSLNPEMKKALTGAFLNRLATYSDTLQIDAINDVLEVKDADGIEISAVFPEQARMLRQRALQGASKAEARAERQKEEQKRQKTIDVFNYVESTEASLRMNIADIEAEYSNDPTARAFKLKQVAQEYRNLREYIEGQSDIEPKVKDELRDQMVDSYVALRSGVTAIENHVISKARVEAEASLMNYLDSGEVDPFKFIEDMKSGKEFEGFSWMDMSLETRQAINGHLKAIKTAMQTPRGAQQKKESDQDGEAIISDIATQVASVQEGLVDIGEVESLQAGLNGVNTYAANLVMQLRIRASTEFNEGVADRTSPFPTTKEYEEVRQKIDSRFKMYKDLVRERREEVEKVKASLGTLPDGTTIGGPDEIRNGLLGLDKSFRRFSSVLSDLENGGVFAGENKQTIDTIVTLLDSDEEVEAFVNELPISPEEKVEYIEQFKAFSEETTQVDPQALDAPSEVAKRTDGESFIPTVLSSIGDVAEETGLDVAVGRALSMTDPPKEPIYSVLASDLEDAKKVVDEKLSIERGSVLLTNGNDGQSEMQLRNNLMRRELSDRFEKKILNQSAIKKDPFGPEAQRLYGDLYALLADSRTVVPRGVNPPKHTEKYTRGSKSLAALYLSLLEKRRQEYLESLEQEE